MIRLPLPFLVLRALLLLPLLPLVAPAQNSATGSIAGRVSDAASGRSLQGAIVRLVGSRTIDYTDSDGRFVLSGVPVGPQRVEIDYVGLDSVVRDVSVAAGTASPLTVSLESKALKLEAFTVSESGRRPSGR